MIYEIKFKTEAECEFLSFDKSVRVLIAKQIQKLSISPELGELLGNKAGYELSGCRKMYVDNKRIRIVYRIIENQIIVEVIAVGKRNEMEVYKTAASRLNKNED
jgi:mRNA interferase RelE/StbE